MALKVWLLDFLKYICYRVQTDEEKFLEMWAVRALIKLSKGHIILESLWEFSLFFSFLHSWLNFLINICRFLGYPCHLLLALVPFSNSAPHALVLNILLTFLFVGYTQCHYYFSWLLYTYFTPGKLASLQKLLFKKEKLN